MCPKLSADNSNHIRQFLPNVVKRNGILYHYRHYNSILKLHTPRQKLPILHV